MDFDGLEGCLASGQGDFAAELFTKIFYDNLDHTVLNGTSISKPFYWHINTYCNWGEPWYEGFCESMQEYRISNQSLFERNFLPNMLGWYQLTAATSLSEMEWMLARAAGYDAGFALATDLESLHGNPDTEKLLDAVREWEDARHNNVFSEEQKDRLKNPKFQFHLVKVSEGVWDLYPYRQSADFVYSPAKTKRAKPQKQEWQWENIDAQQVLQFRLKVTGDSGIIQNPAFEIDRYQTIQFPVEMKAGESLLCEGTGEARIYDAKGRQISTVHCSSEIPVMSQGIHTLRFSSTSEGASLPNAVIAIITIREPERVTAK
jgi:hypothetical protein